MGNFDLNGLIMLNRAVIELSFMDKNRICSPHYNSEYSHVLSVLIYQCT